MRRPLLLLFFLLSCHTVSASSNRDTARELLQTRESIASERELRERLRTLKPGETVVLDTRRITLAEPLELNTERTTIEGARNRRTIIECGEQLRGSALIIRTAAVEVKHLVFKNCSRHSAVSINISSGKESKDKEIEFEDVRFKRNGQHGVITKGAALSAELCTEAPCIKTLIRFRFCRFIQNNARFGGAIYVNNTDIDIRDSRFEGNTAIISGGGIHFTSNQNSTIAIENTVFLRNNATGDNTISECKMNQSTTENCLGTGGGAYFLNPSLLNVTNSIFESNSGCGGGGALTLVRGNPKIIFQVTSSTFDDNLAFCGLQPDALRHNFENQLVHLGGAIMYQVVGDGETKWEIHNCRFHRNKALAGGAVSIQGTPLSASIHTISASTFIDHVGLLAAGTFSVMSANLDMMSTTIKNSRSNNGGGLLVWRGGELRVLEDSRNPEALTVVENCTAIYGGAFYIDGAGSVEATALVIRNNTAFRYGAAIRIFSSDAQMTFRGITVENNRALAGAGIALYALPNITITSDRNGKRSVFRDNVASIGGGIYYEPGHDVFVYVAIENSDFIQNRAVRLESPEASSIEEEEREFQPDPSAGVIVPDVDEQLNGFTLLSFLSDVPEGHGGAICMTLVAARLFTISEITFENITMTENEAIVGGGLSLHMSELNWNEPNSTKGCFPAAFGLDTCQRFLFVNVTATDNIAEYAAGVYSSLPQGIIMSCTRQGSDVFRTDHVQNNGFQSDYTEAYCTYVFGNRFVDGREDPNGRDVGTRAVRLRAKNAKDGLAEVASADDLIVKQGSASSQETDRMEYLQIEVLDVFWQRIFRGIDDANLELTLNSDSIAGALRYKAENGIAVIDSTQAWGVSQRDFLEISSEKYPGVNLTLELSTRACRPGESNHDHICTECPRDQYGFDPSHRCISCEAAADCSGGAKHVPQDGYWHSTPFSPAFHDCLHPKACNFEGRMKNLKAFFDDPEKVQKRLDEFNQSIGNGTVGSPSFDDDYKQCDVGYTGILCGSCQQNYGHSVTGDCEKCPDDNTRSGLIILFTIGWFFILIGVNCVITLLSINARIEHVKHEMRVSNGVHQRRFKRSTQVQPRIKPRHPNRRDIAPEQQPAQTPVSGAWDGSLVNTPDSPTAESSDQKLLAQQLVATVQLTETLKILINYLQITSAALRLQTDWSTLLKGLLQVENGLTGLSSEVLDVPYECNFEDSGGDPTINAFWMRFSTPWIVLVALLSVFSLSWTSSIILRRRRDPHLRSEDNYSRRRFCTCAIVIVVVTTYFSYIAVVREFLGAVNCIEIEEPAKQLGEQNGSHYIQYATEPGGERHWAEDTEYVCYKGKHLPVGIIGIIGLVWSFCGVISIIAWLPLNQKRVNDPEFVARYWFIYQAYRSKWYTASWEATVLARKAIISAVIVFSNHLSPTLQATMCTGSLIIWFLLHEAALPFKIPEDHDYIPEYAGHFLAFLRAPKITTFWLQFHNSINLNSLESASIAGSIIIFYSAIILHDSNASPLGRTTMVTFAFVVNVTFLIYILFRLYAGMHIFVDLKLELKNAAFMAAHENTMGVVNLAVKGMEMMKLGKSPDADHTTVSDNNTEPEEDLSRNGQEPGEVVVDVQPSFNSTHA